MSNNPLHDQEGDKKDNEWQYRYQAQFSPEKPYLQPKIVSQELNHSPDSSLGFSPHGPSANTNPSTLNSENMNFRKEFEYLHDTQFVNDPRTPTNQHSFGKNINDDKQVKNSFQLGPLRESQSEICQESPEKKRSLQNKNNNTEVFGNAQQESSSTSLVSTSSNEELYDEKLEFNSPPKGSSQTKILSILKPADDLNILSETDLRKYANRQSQMTEPTSCTSNNETVSTSMLFDSSSPPLQSSSNKSNSAHNLRNSLPQPIFQQPPLIHQNVTTPNRTFNSFNYNRTEAIPSSDFSGNPSEQGLSSKDYLHRQPPSMSFQNESFVSNTSNQYSSRSGSQDMLSKSLQMKRKTRKTNHDYHGKRQILGEKRIVTPSSTVLLNDGNSKMGSNMALNNQYDNQKQKNSNLKNMYHAADGYEAKNMFVKAQPVDYPYYDDYDERELNLSIFKWKTVYVVSIGLLIPCLFFYFGFIIADEKLLTIMFSTVSEEYDYLQYPSNIERKQSLLKTFRCVCLGTFVFECCILILAIVLLLTLAR